MTTSLTTQQALALWRAATVEMVTRAEADLTARQLAIMLTVYLSPPPHTVRNLAASLKVSKPAVSRALHLLERLGLARRKRDDADRRSVLVQRTIKGSVYLSELAEIIARASGTIEE